MVTPTTAVKIGLSDEYLLLVLSDAPFPETLHLGG